MTTLYNRAFFNSCLAEKVKQARANRRAALSLLYLDIDDFKSYNDSYGHPEGDYVLRRVAQAIIAALRDEDIAARCGGEEFAVIVGCGAHAAARAAERVRASVEMSCSPLRRPAHQAEHHGVGWHRHAWSASGHGTRACEGGRRPHVRRQETREEPDLGQ